LFALSAHGAALRIINRAVVIGIKLFHHALTHAPATLTI
jgi:hypothetical protein